MQKDKMFTLLLDISAIMPKACLDNCSASETKMCKWLDELFRII